MKKSTKEALSTALEFVAIPPAIVCGIALLALSASAFVATTPIRLYRYRNTLPEGN